MARRTTQREEETESEILVKVGRVGSAVIEVVLNGARTVGDALAAAEITTRDHDILRVNGEAVERSDELEDGDILVVAGSIKGGL